LLAPPFTEMSLNIHHSYAVVDMVLNGVHTILRSSLFWDVTQRRLVVRVVGNYQTKLHNIQNE